MKRNVMLRAYITFMLATGLMFVLNSCKDDTFRGGSGCDSGVLCGKECCAQGKQCCGNACVDVLKDERHCNACIRLVTIYNNVQMALVSIVRRAGVLMMGPELKIVMKGRSCVWGSACPYKQIHTIAAIVVFYVR